MGDEEQVTQLGGVVEFYRDEAGEVRWRLKAQNGEVVAVGEGHRDQLDAQRAFEGVVRMLRSEPGVEMVFEEGV